MPGEIIPMKFEHENKSYSGYLQAVFGAGTFVWHLMIDNFYHGCLMHSEKGFVFHGNQKGNFHTLAERFGEQVMLWYE